MNPVSGSRKIRLGASRRWGYSMCESKSMVRGLRWSVAWSLGPGVEPVAAALAGTNAGSAPKRVGRVKKQTRRRRARAHLTS